MRLFDFEIGYFKLFLEIDHVIFSGFREPLLGEKNHVTSFWHRLSGKSSASSDNISAHMLRLNMESNGHMDDHVSDM